MNSAYERLAEYTPEDVSARAEEIRAWLVAQLPQIDARDPVLNSVWIVPLSQYLIESEAILESLEQFGQLSEAAIAGIEDESIKAEIRSQIAKSLSVPEIPSAFASGEVKVTVASSETIVVPQGTVFTAGGQNYSTDQAYVLRSVANSTGVANERLLIENSDGAYEGTVPVVATTPGSGGNQPTGAAFTTSIDIPDLITVTADTNFVGGRNANDLQDIINAVRAQEYGRTLGTRDQITAFLHSRTDIPDVQQVGVIGFGDPEMQRDKSFFSPLGGGKADFYIASATYPTTQEVNLTARVTARGNGVVQLTLPVGRDVSPGFLRVIDVRDNTSGELLQVTNETRGFDLSFEMDQQTPIIEDPQHATFSAYQTADLTLAGTFDAEVDDNRTVTVRFQRAVGIKTAQELVSGRFYRYVGGDTLVRAAIPTFLRMNIRMSTAFSPQIPDAEKLKQAVAEEIMRRPMRTGVYYSEIVQAISPYLPEDMAVDSIEYDAVRIGTDGVSSRAATINNYVVETFPEAQISPRTVAIYTLPTDIQISIDQKIAYETP